MTVHRLLYLLGAIFIAELALAKMPFTNEVLGKAEGTLDYCARVDSRSAEKYQKKKKDMVKGVSEKEVEEARASEEYKAGYDWVTEELPKMPKDESVGACAAALEEKKQ
jgi:hypothetical protein